MKNGTYIESTQHLGWLYGGGEHGRKFPVEEIGYLVPVYQNPGMVYNGLFCLAVVVCKGAFKGVPHNCINICFQLFRLYTDGKFQTEIIQFPLGDYFIGKSLGKGAVYRTRYSGGRQFVLVAPLAYIGYVIACDIGCG